MKKWKFAKRLLVLMLALILGMGDAASTMVAYAAQEVEEEYILLDLEDDSEVVSDEATEEIEEADEASTESDEQVDEADEEIFAEFLDDGMMLLTSGSTSTLAAGDSVEVTIAAGETVSYVITPDVTQGYRFYTTGDYDTYGELYDSDGNLITCDDDSGEYTNFCIDCTLVEGETYVLQVELLYDYESGTITLYAENYESSDLKASAEDSYIGVRYAESATLQVNASVLKGGITYQWYKYTDDVDECIEDVTGASYEISSVTENAEYYCCVSDDYGTSYTIWFEVYIDNNLKATVAGSTKTSATYTVEPNSSLTLAVSASSYTNSFTYQWYEVCKDGDYTYTYLSENSAEIQLTDIKGYCYYRCYIYDEFDNYVCVYFYIYVDNNFTVTVNGTDDVAYWDNEVDACYYVAPGGSVTLDVNASCTDGDISYIWYQYCVNGVSYYQYLSNGGNSITIANVQGSCYYECTLYDEYGNYWYVYFWVYVDNEFSASAASGSAKYVLAGDSATMTVSASCLVGDITYTWYSRIYDDDDGYYYWQELDCASSSYTATNIQEYSRYYCYVADEYGSSAYIYFSIYIADSLVAYADSYHYSIDYGDTITLTTKAISPNGTISYQWYTIDEDGNYSIISGARSASLSLTPSQYGYSYYKCVVTDGVDTDSYTFSVYVSSGLEISYTYYNYITAGSTATLNVTATSGVSNPTFTYCWYKYDDDDNKVSLNCSTSSYSTASSGYYCCTVSDGKTTATAYFYVYVYSGLSVSYDENVFYVTEGDTQTLSVSASTEYGTLTYTWYAYDSATLSYVQIAGSDGSLTVTADGVHSSYECVVSDGYNSRYVYFYVYAMGKTTDSFEDAVELSADTAKLATIDDDTECMYFVITPSTSGEYTFYTLTNLDTYGYLYDEDGNLLDYNDDGGDGNNFRITYSLEAGKTYYLAVRFYGDGTGSFYVYMATGDDIIYADPSDEELVHTHSYSDYIYKAATCTVEGIRRHECLCGDYYDEAIAATGHTAASSWTTTKAATCGATGTKVKYCTVCGEAAETATISKTSSHSYGSWKTTTAATALKTGVKTRTCSVCGKKETKTISKLTATITVNATTIKLKYKQSTTGLVVSGLAKGDYVKSYKSSNTKIFTVNSKGKITAKSKTGSAKLTITLASGKTKTITIKVQKSTVKTTKITLSSTKVSIKKGKTYKLSSLVTLTPFTSGQKITYTSSNKKIATVNSSGKVTAKKKGTCYITIKSGSKSKKVKITVK